MNNFNGYTTSFGAQYADATASKGADVQPYKYNKQKGKNLQPTFHYSSIIKMRIQTKKINSIWNIHRFYYIYITCILCFCMSHTIMAQKVVSDNLLFINHPKYGLKCMGFADTTVVCKKLIFPDSILINGKNYPITNIENCAFNNNKYLQYVRLPNTLQSIGLQTFSNCSNLDSVYIPASVIDIYDDAFYNSNLISIRVAPENPCFDSRDNSCAIIDSRTNELIVGSANTIIPASVTKLGRWAFTKRKKLKHITIPKNIRSIDIKCFYDCENLTSVTFEDADCLESDNNGLSINNSVFGHCKSLKDILLPNRLESIGIAAFHGCKKLRGIYIPSRVQYIGGFLFAKSPRMKSVVVSLDNKYYDSRNQCNAIIETKSNNLVATCPATEIPNDLTAIGEGAFEDVNLDNIIIPDGVKSIGSCAFGSSGTHNITLPESVNKIDILSFCNCTKLNIYLKHTTPPILTKDEDIVESYFLEDVLLPDYSGTYEYLKMLCFYVPEDAYKKYIEHPIWSKLNIKKQIHKE